MVSQPGTSYAERELKYQARKEISKGIRKNCTEPTSDPIVAGVTVMLGIILEKAVSMPSSRAKAREGRGDING